MSCVFLIIVLSMPFDVHGMTALACYLSNCTLVLFLDFRLPACNYSRMLLYPLVAFTLFGRLRFLSNINAFPDPLGAIGWGISVL